MFVHSEKHDEELITRAVNGHFRVIFVCAEMLESPTFATVIHSKLVRARLTGIYVDEAHLVHESCEWRTSYSRLHQLRPIVGENIPLVAISATLPPTYRQSLQAYAGLKPSHHLINLGNFRPELSTVVMPLRHDASSFLDLAFVLPEGATADGITKTIVYCDNTDMLTEMFWWFHHRLQSFHLPTHLLDILHAGLSKKHEHVALRDFRNGPARIFLGTEKIGAGLNFPAVERVIIYQVLNDLSLAKFEQRKGRAGREKGTTGIGILMVQPELLDDVASSEKTMFIDPGLLKLIRTTEGCLETAIDDALGNPPRSYPSTTARHCCSNCHPSLLPPRTFQWVMVDPGDDAQNKQQTAKLCDEQLEQVSLFLKRWRLDTWRTEWRSQFIGLGPSDLIPDSDIEAVTRRVTTISCVGVS